MDKLKDITRSIKPDIVISCLRGEFDQQFEFHKQLAFELQNSSGQLYYFSTANVFDGDNSRHHIETDAPVAESDYGKFKIVCENTLKQILDQRAIIIRIPTIWGKNSPRMNLIKEKNILRFNKCDETGNTFYRGLASNRNDIPGYLQSTNESIISYLSE